MNVKMTLVVTLMVAATMPLFTGCATVTRGTSEVLVVETEPSGASVRLSNGMVGTSPTSFKIPRKGDVNVTIFKEGYEPLEVHVNTQVAGAGAAGMAGNVLVGGLIGAGIDSFSGGMLEHKPNPVKVTLVPRPIAATAAAVVAPVAAQLPPAVVPAPPSEPASMPIQPAPATLEPASSVEPVPGSETGPAPAPAVQEISIAEVNRPSEAPTPETANPVSETEPTQHP